MCIPSWSRTRQSLAEWVGNVSCLESDDLQDLMTQRTRGFVKVVNSLSRIKLLKETDIDKNLKHNSWENAQKHNWEMIRRCFVPKKQQHFGGFLVQSVVVWHQQKRPNLPD